MTDIAPELIEEIRTKFQTAMMKDRELNQALAAIRNGSVSCNDALTYADEIGAALQKAVSEVLSADVLPDGTMYYNIAERLINEVYGDAFDLAEDASERVMKSINDSAGIGLKVQPAGTKKEHLSELIESVAGKEYSGRIVTDFLSATRSCPMTAAADTLAANADLQSSAGRAPQIVRTAHIGACEECIKLAGTYDYPGVSKRVFWRHGSCRCTVEYHPGDGTSQNVHTKKWTGSGDNAKIKTQQLAEADHEKDLAEARKTIGIVGLADQLADFPARLASYTPQSLKEALEDAGYLTKALGRGSLKGISFEDGGGYRIHFGGDGLIQYHPEDKSHHGGAYYKISTQRTGTKRYDINGNEIKD